MILAFMLALQQAPVVAVPRVEATAHVDGVLDEAVWRQAARLDGFRQNEPDDGRDAVEKTEVLVWYAPDAIWFGVRAFDSQPQSIRATRTDRDEIDDEDHVILYLDTFRDRRRAFFFAVNAMGVQSDGVRTEGSASAGRTFGGGLDKSPDFLWDAQSRITDDGYVIEIRVPFKSLRYPAADAMEWGINVERHTQRTGFVDMWPEVRRASASFLAQGGTLTGLHDLQRGVVVEVQPFLTVSSTGVRLTDPVGAGSFERLDSKQDVGANLRLGFTNFSLDATVNPDFSQVEADASQVTVNERFALFVAEKRPFFLEGIELFATPNQLVYTRRIAAPIAGAKVTGKVGALNVAYMSALDEDVDSEGRNALFNVARLRRDVGTSSSVGVTFTDRSVLDTDDYNRVASADARYVFGGMYYLEGQFGTSWTERSDESLSAPIWKLEFDRTGRVFGFNYALNGVGDEFITEAGFVNRRDIMTLRAMNRLTWYAPAGRTLERINVFFGANNLWRHSAIDEGPTEGDAFINSSFRFRGDWEVSARGGRDFVELDPQNFSTFQVQTGAGLRPYSPLDGVSGPEFELSVNTPVYQLADGRASVGAGRVAIFAEGGEGNARSVGGSVSLRPAPGVRVGVSSTYQRLTRARDGSEFARTILPRAIVEVQPTRAFFVRAIAEYRSERRAALRDARTGELLVIGGAPSQATDTDGMRMDVLASYQPTPGTVAFLGYGATLSGRELLRFDGVRREADGLFLKLAYQFRR